MIPIVATTRPESFGQCWYLCRSCHGTGELERSPVQVKAAAKTSAMKVRLVSRTGAPMCPRCDGRGLELR